MGSVMEQLVYKSNALIESAYRLSVLEQRIVLACIAQVRRDEEITDQVLYKVTASELAELSGGSVDSLYSKLKDAVLRLMERKIWLKEEPNGNGLKPRVMIARWVQAIAYNDSAGEIELRFAHDVLPYISQLKSHFTKYKLKEIGGMDSAYAIRLFELFVQYKSLGQRDIAVDELRELLQLENKYPKIAEIKRRVINPAVDQINEHSSLSVSYKERKSGRKITAFVFVFKEKPASKSRSNQTIEHTPEPKKVLKTQAEMDKLGRPGESRPELIARLKQQGYQWTFKPMY